MEGERRKKRMVRAGRVLSIFFKDSVVTVNIINIINILNINNINNILSIINIIKYC